MASCYNKNAMIPIFLLFSLYFSDYIFFQGVKSLGINYGQVANNLPSPEKVLDLLTSLKLTKARIYDTNPQVLAAFVKSNVELIVTIENEKLATLSDPQQALQWVNTNIKPYFPATKITGIAVGNEIFTDNETSLIQYLVPAITNIHWALQQFGIANFIEISTPNSLVILDQSFPPSAGSFKPEVTGVMSEYLEFLSRTKSPFWINAYPYFAYKDCPNNISLDYVLFNPNSGMVDPYTKLHYDNMLYAQVDAIIFAMAKLGFSGIEVRVSETGWPSKGDEDEFGATVENAAIYNRNLLRRQMENEGTPLRPNWRLEVYLFSLFNEDMKPGPTSERNYGLYQPDCTMAYNVGLFALTTSSSTTSPSSSMSSSSSSSSSSTSFSIFSSASKAPNKDYQRLVYLMFVYLLAFKFL